MSTRWEEVRLTRKYVTAPARKIFIDEIKIDLCKKIKRAALRDRYTNRELALMLGTSQGRVSKVMRMRVENLTIDILFNYLHLIEPRTQVLVAI